MVLVVTRHAPFIYQKLVKGDRIPLRGGLDADMLTLEDDQLQDHHHDIIDPGHTHGYEDNHQGTFWYNGDIDYDHPVCHREDHERTFYSSHTGLKVDGVANAYRKEGETKPRNMNFHLYHEDLVKPGLASGLPC